MSDTPQNDETINEDVNEVVEINNSAVDSETTTPVEGELTQQVDEVELAKQKANEAFNKQYGEKKQLERDNAAQAEKLAKFEQAERERQAAQVGDIPPMPDAFDDDFEAKVKQRDEAIIANANYQAQNQAYLQQEQFNQQQAAQAKQLEGQKVLQAHNDRVKNLGIKPEAMVAAENAVMSYGLPPELLTHIAGMADSPLVINHLAANPVEGYELANLVASTPYAVGAYLDKINEKASALKPKISSAPKPAANLQGNGVDPDMGKYQNIKGAKFE
jgi:hypothetical protein